jgi:hypothetical protein
MSKNLKAMHAAMLREAFKSKAELDEASRTLQATNGLDAESARVVAAAVRTATIKELGQEYGLDDMEIGGIVGEETDPTDLEGADTGGDKPAGDPKNLVEEYEQSGDLPMPDDDFDDDELDSDSSDNGMTQLQFEVPTDMANEAADEIDELLSEILGENDPEEAESIDLTADHFDEDSDEFEEEDDDALVLNDPEDLAGEDDVLVEEDTSDEDLLGSERGAAGFKKRPTTLAASRGTTTMDNNIAERRELRAAMREASTRVANDGTTPKNIGLGQDTVSGTYGGAKAEAIQRSDKAAIKGEKKAPATTKTNSEGNSLKGENPTFNKRKLYTKNPDRLQHESEYETSTFENESSVEDYKVDFNTFMPPSKGEADRSPGFEVPTQNPDYTTNRNTVTASADESADAEDHMFRTLLAAGVPENTLEAMSLEQGRAAYEKLMAQRAAGKKTEWFKNNIEKDLEDGEEEYEGELEEVGKKAEKVDISINAKTAGEEASLRKEFANAMEHEIKRVKAAYSVNTQLAVHGVIKPEEVDSHVEMWLNDGMSVRAMFVQGQMLLRTASNLQKQVAASAGDQMVRTSSRGISSAPAVVHTPQYQGAVESNELSSLFSIGRLPRGAFNQFREYDESQQAYGGSYGREFNP